MEIRYSQDEKYDKDKEIEELKKYIDKLEKELYNKSVPKKEFNAPYDGG